VPFVSISSVNLLDLTAVSLVKSLLGHF